MKTFNLMKKILNLERLFFFYKVFVSHLFFFDNQRREMKRTDNFNQIKREILIYLFLTSVESTCSAKLK